MICDAHIHFNMKCMEPTYDIIKNFHNNNISHAVLILNTPAEKKEYLCNMDLLKTLDIKIHIAVIQAPNVTDFNELLPRMCSNNIPYSIKFHPRLSNITRDNFLDTSNLVSTIKSSTVIVDCFPYGDNIANHIGIDLAVYLAKQFPEKKIVIAHAGGIELLRCMMTTRTLSNIFYDYSLTSCYLKNTSVEKDLVHFLKFNWEKIMFGSDYPDFTIEKSLQIMDELCENAGLDLQQRQAVFAQNALNIYDLGG